MINKEFRQEMKRGAAVVAVAYLIAGILLVAVLLSSCSPQIVEQVRTEYVYRDRVQVDTTFVHDSTFIREFTKGDTIRVTEYRDRYVYQYKFRDRTDTLFVRDSVAVERVKEVRVERKLTLWEKARIWAFFPLLILSVWAYRKQLLALIRKVLLKT